MTKKIELKVIEQICNKKNINISKSAIIMNNCRFRFDGESKTNSIRIGEDCMINCHFIFESDAGEISIGDKTYISSGTSLISRKKIMIGDHVTIAWGCTIYDHNSHSLDYKERRKDLTDQLESYRNNQLFTDNKSWDSVKSKQIVIENDVWVGFGCTILNGVTIGKGSVIGANSVVREDIEPWTVMAGNPAVIIKRLNPGY